MTLDVSEVVNDPVLGESFTIIRQYGTFVLGGGWQVQNTKTITAFGVITPVTAKELRAIPEADRITEGWFFYSQTEMLTTRGDGTKQNTSDILLRADGNKYRIVQVKDYTSRGYWRALAGRMAGN